MSTDKDAAPSALDAIAAAFAKLQDEHDKLRESLAAKERECERLQNDSRRIDALEDALWHGSVGNGIAIFPCTMMRDGKKCIDISALGHEDGSNLGEELVGCCIDLRDAIDKLGPALSEGGAE